MFPSGANKLALLVGIEYVKYAESGAASRLPGCHVDAASLSAALAPLGYAIAVLADDGAHPEPTRAAIEQALVELAAAAHRPGVTDVFVGYSGHGTSVRDTSGDERDRKDEVIVPADYQSAGFIVDDWLLAKFVRACPTTVRIRAIFDSCHSGSILDLPHGLDAVGGPYVESSAVVPQNAVAISGCRDSQTSASTPDPRSPSGWSGALTRSILTGNYLSAAPSAFLPNLAKMMSAAKLGQRPVGSASKLSLFDEPFVSPS